MGVGAEWGCPVNYVRQCQRRIAELEAMVGAYESAINAFRAHLHSEKFAGEDSDGERKDWIATGDVLNWLREVQLGASVASSQVVFEPKLTVIGGRIATEGAMAPGVPRAATERFKA